MITRYKLGSYGALLASDYGKYVEFRDIGAPPGRRSDLYCCMSCEQIHHESDDPPESPPDSDDLYCPECANEERQAAEESSYAYFNRYIAGDR